MTKQEAIAHLRYRKIVCEDHLKVCPKDPIASKDKEMYDMAIKALEEETVSRETYEHEYYFRKLAEQRLYEIQRNTSDNCVSREAVLNTLDTTDEFLDEDRTIENYKDLLEECYKVLPSCLFTQKWVAVSERLPEPNKLVICYITTGTTETYFLALWNDVQEAWEEGIGGYRLLERDLGYKVIAWTPLPEPYEAEKDDKE